MEAEFSIDSNERSSEVESLNLAKISTFDYEAHFSVINLIVTVGGDGTILYASKIFAFAECPPVVCFSMGSLGYLCNFKVTDYETILDKVLRY